MSAEDCRIHDQVESNFIPFTIQTHFSWHEAIKLPTCLSYC